MSEPMIDRWAGGDVDPCDPKTRTRLLEQKLAALTTALEAEELALVLYEHEHGLHTWDELIAEGRFSVSARWISLAHAIRRHCGLEEGKEKP